jgi:hypothetical protein
MISMATRTGKEKETCNEIGILRGTVTEAGAKGRRATDRDVKGLRQRVGEMNVFL